MPWLELKAFLSVKQIVCVCVRVCLNRRQALVKTHVQATAGNILNSKWLSAKLCLHLGTVRSSESFIKEMKFDRSRKWLTAPQAQMYWHEVVEEEIMVFKEKSDLAFSFISVWCVCPWIKPSSHSANVTFMQQEWSVPCFWGSDTEESHTFRYDLFIVCQYCGFQMLCEPVCQVPGGLCGQQQQPEMPEDLAAARKLLGDWGCGCSFHVSMLLCAQIIKLLYSLAFLHFILL